MATLVEEATAPGAGKEKGLPEEVQKVLAAIHDLAYVDSNKKGGGGCALYHAAREALEEATESLEELGTEDLAKLSTWSKIL